MKMGKKGNFAGAAGLGGVGRGVNCQNQPLRDQCATKIAHLKIGGKSGGKTDGTARRFDSRAGETTTTMKTHHLIIFGSLLAACNGFGGVENLGAAAGGPASLWWGCAGGGAAAPSLLGVWLSTWQDVLWCSVVVAGLVGLGLGLWVRGVWMGETPGAEAPAPAPLQTFAPHSEGVRLISVERARQVTAEGWWSGHDDEHVNAEIALAAVAYLVAHADEDTAYARPWWPWNMNSFKPAARGDVRNLVKAGALVAAEIDRLLRETPHWREPQPSPLDAAGVVSLGEAEREVSRLYQAKLEAQRGEDPAKALEAHEAWVKANYELRDMREGGNE